MKRDRALYLDLLQAHLTGELDQDPMIPMNGRSGYDPRLREYGADWPSTALTMIGRRRLQNLRWLAERVLDEGVPGDFIETGVWRGGACILLRAVLQAHGEHERRVWVADSFQGLPAPDGPDQNSELHRYPELAVSQAEVRANFQRYGLLDEQVRFLPGWFKDTLPGAPIERLALLRLDGDHYRSTVDALRALEPKLSPGGALIVDDYHAIPECRRAVEDYLRETGQAPRIEDIDGTGVFWRKALPARTAPQPATAAQGHVYDYRAAPGDGSAASLLLGLAEGARNVLELGAGPGSVSRLLSEAGHRVVALEKDPRCLPLLSGRCAEAVQGDLEGADWEASVREQGPYDAIVLGDVLEHLREPQALLPRLRPLLADGGAVLLSLPHACYGPLLASLLQEDFAYGPIGLLDRTHLRFFGLKNIEELVAGAGYKIARAELVRLAPERSEFAEAWRRASPQQRVLLSESPFADVYQVVLKAVPAADWPGESLSLLDLAPGGRALAPVAAAPAVTGPRLVAFHLPQFHPFAENDEWWGRGFTEWTNVTRALPAFRGHEQPQLPADLGFYDLRLPASMRAQAQLAAEHGIHAFCYHYYWFNGRRLMQEPLQNLLLDPEHKLPFCLCWANESWTRRWDGADDDVLIAQTYEAGWAERFFRDLLPYLRDGRYLRQDGLPLLLVYRAQRIPQAAAVFQQWRQWAREAGLGGLHICAALTHGNTDVQSLGADSGVEFPPHNNVLPLMNEGMAFERPFGGRVHDYSDLAEHYLAKRYQGLPVFRTVVPSWDNSARIGERAYILINASPHNYEHWLTQALRLSAEEQPGRQPLLFINAWNEWAEGCHLEPDQRHRRAYLEATQRVSRGLSQAGGFQQRGLDPRELGAGWRRWPERVWRFLGRQQRLKAWVHALPGLRRLLRSLRQAWR